MEINFIKYLFKYPFMNLINSIYPTKLLTTFVNAKCKNGKIILKTHGLLTLDSAKF